MAEPWLPSRHDALKAQCAALPIGPWRVQVIGHTLRVIDGRGNDLALIGDCRDADKVALAWFIVNAPRTISAMLGEIERLTGEYMALVKQLEPDTW